MRAIATMAPTNLAAVDERDPEAGGASHRYAIQFGGPGEVCRIQFRHGPPGEAGSEAGVFDDDLLAVVEDRISAFQAGPFACSENAEALAAVQAARRALGLRVARRLAQGVLGANREHTEGEEGSGERILMYVAEGQEPAESRGEIRISITEEKLREWLGLREGESVSFERHVDPERWPAGGYHPDRPVAVAVVAEGGEAFSFTIPEGELRKEGREAYQLARRSRGFRDAPAPGAPWRPATSEEIRRWLRLTPSEGLTVESSLSNGWRRVRVEPPHGSPVEVLGCAVESKGQRFEFTIPASAGPAQARAAYRAARAAVNPEERECEPIELSEDLAAVEIEGEEAPVVRPDQPLTPAIVKEWLRLEDGQTVEVRREKVKFPARGTGSLVEVESITVHSSSGSRFSFTVAPGAGPVELRTAWRKCLEALT